MTKSPFLNAGAAAIYIAAVASFLFYGVERIDEVDTILIPMAMLSLFVLSATIMGLVFFYQPVRLYLNGEKDEAARLLLKTVGIFAGFVALLVGSLFALAIL
jgi:hypothetical protein